jgi:ArsR family transcriptional regulator, arsenate/arsenite/antimonite-responsive transcriptional repressor
MTVAGLHYICQREYMKRDRQIDSLETVFKALADRTRLRIIGLLAAGEICVCHIHGSLGIPQPMASRHLAYLRRAGLVEARKSGLWVHYRLASLPDSVLQVVLDAVGHAIGHLRDASADRRRLARLTPIAVYASPAADYCSPAAPRPKRRARR